MIGAGSVSVATDAPVGALPLTPFPLDATLVSDNKGIMRFSFLPVILDCRRDTRIIGYLSGDLCAR